MSNFKWCWTSKVLWKKVKFVEKEWKLKMFPVPEFMADFPLYFSHEVWFLLVQCVTVCVYAGNTCYLNSVMQVLYYTPSFVDNINVLCKEMKTTITDYNSIRAVAVSIQSAIGIFILCWFSALSDVFPVNHVLLKITVRFGFLQIRSVWIWMRICCMIRVIT